MGLDINGSRFLLAEKKRGLALGRLLTLGRQEIFMTSSEYSAILNELGVTQTEETYGDDFFHGLGASILEIMDASGYEGAALIHDLNIPIGPEHHSSFDTVIDGGTLEHVFHFPNSIKNCMDLVKPGGNLILMTPWHNYSGHGFYQFSPELFYNILSPANGYIVERMLIVSKGYWYEVRNPSDIKRRIQIASPDAIDLFIRAKRTGSERIFQTWPQQSDYSAAWEQGSYDTSSNPTSGTLKSKLVDRIAILQRLQQKWRRLKLQRSLSPSSNPGMVRLCRSQEIPS
jgi:SAM-dependent methyltransferase